MHTQCFVLHLECPVLVRAEGQHQASADDRSGNKNREGKMIRSGRVERRSHEQRPRHASERKDAIHPAKDFAERGKAKVMTNQEGHNIRLGAKAESGHGGEQ